jgi:hypothetical protein
MIAAKELAAEMQKAFLFCAAISLSQDQPALPPNVLD